MVRRLMLHVTQRWVQPAHASEPLDRPFRGRGSQTEYHFQLEMFCLFRKNRHRPFVEDLREVSSIEYMESLLLLHMPRRRGRRFGVPMSQRTHRFRIYRALLGSLLAHPARLSGSR